MTGDEALAYLDGLVNHERRYDPQAMRAVRLERMAHLCRRLGDPQRWFRSIVVAGTNGKGSIAAMLYAMLRETSLRVGLYTSPHLESLRERIRVWDRGPAGGSVAHGDDWITPEALGEAIGRLAAVSGHSETPTYFEALTAAAFLHFQQRAVEVAVLEVGLGGRLDATNVVHQAVTVFGGIDYDHAEVLGEDLVFIAREKAGVLKPGQTAITVPQHDVVEEVLRLTAEEQGVPLLRIGREIVATLHEHSSQGLRVTVAAPRGLYEDLEVPLLGRHQAVNAAAAVTALEALSTAGSLADVVRRGLGGCEWPGRLEIVQEDPLVILDGAHNPQALEALGLTLAELWPAKRFHVILGLSADKWQEAVGQMVGRLGASVTCTRSRSPRAMDPAQLAVALRPFTRDVHVMADAADAYTYLLNGVPPTDGIIVTGSMYLVGELRAALRKAGVHKPRREPAPAA